MIGPPRLPLARPGRALDGVVRRLQSPFGPDPATVADWWRLRNHPVWRGEGVPDGGGRSVLLVPGFGAPSLSMQPLRSWFERTGHRPRVASVHLGANCAEATARGLERQLEDVASESARRVLIVAHSRGGQFARVAVHRRPDLVAGLVTLGAPFEFFSMHPAVKALALATAVAGTAGVPNLVRSTCLRGECCAAFRRDLAAPWTVDVPFAAIYSRADRTVRWRTCLDDAAENVEVAAGHVGMLVSHESYAAIARFVRRLPQDA